MGEKDAQQRASISQLLEMPNVAESIEKHSVTESAQRTGSATSSASSKSTLNDRGSVMATAKSMPREQAPRPAETQRQNGEGTPWRPDQQIADGCCNRLSAAVHVCTIS